MKNIPYYACLVLLATMIIMIMPTDAEAGIYDDTIRLHILASSDGEEDQALKLAVRDALLTEYGEILLAQESFGEALILTENLIPEITAYARKVVVDMGYSYDVTVSLTKEWYDTRDYADFSLPAGYYTSLRVIIGSGKGRNWWCVMYPPLCMELATESAPPDDSLIDYTKEEITLIKNQGYRVKFKILEEVSRAFAKNS